MFAGMEKFTSEEDEEPHYFTFEVSWEVANKGTAHKTLLSLLLFSFLLQEVKCASAR